MADISFPPREAWVFDRDCAAFPAIVDGTQIKCLISIEALQDRFGARSYDDALPALRSNRFAIEALAEEMIEAGKVQNGEVVIRSADFVRGH